MIIWVSRRIRRSEQAYGANGVMDWCRLCQEGDLDQEDGTSVRWAQRRCCPTWALKPLDYCAFACLMHVDHEAGPAT
jgi:hypothetical protein